MTFQKLLGLNWIIDKIALSTNRLSFVTTKWQLWVIKDLWVFSVLYPSSPFLCNTLSDFNNIKQILETHFGKHFQFLFRGWWLWDLKASSLCRYQLKTRWLNQGRMLRHFSTNRKAGMVLMGQSQICFCLCQVIEP